MGTLAEELIANLAEKYVEKGRAEGRAEGVALGLKKGRAEGVLQLLSERGVNVDNNSRQRILSCTDLATLDLWLKRAITATHISEVLDGSSQ
jgi:hypothetical protein